MCIDGENKDSEFSGLLKQWKELRYSVYEKTNNKSAQIELATAFVLNDNFNYFLKLKKLYNKSEWSNVVQDILKKIGDNSHRGIYVKILIEEKLKQLLLEHCKQNAYKVTEYYIHLLPEYKDDVTELFKFRLYSCQYIISLTSKKPTYYINFSIARPININPAIHDILNLNL